MLEILLLFLIGRNIASIAKRKNRNPVGYVVLFVLAYFGLAVTCGIVGLVAAGAGQAGEDEAMPFVLLGYLIGVATAVGLSYLVVCSVPPLERRPGEYDDYEDYEEDIRSRRRGREDDGSDYDRPRRRRPDDEYEDDEPRPRRRRRDFEDDRD